MTTPRKVLVIDDSRDDAFLIERGLRAHWGGLTFRLVQSASDLAPALTEPWDVILCDYDIPDLPYLYILALYRAAQPGTPFVVVSGTVPLDFDITSYGGGIDGLVNKNGLGGLGDYLDRLLRAKSVNAELDGAADKLHDSLNNLGAEC